jgi:hypothetical protein
MDALLESFARRAAPHRKAILFVDNAGADVVLGMIPLARELLKRGTEVRQPGAAERLRGPQRASLLRGFDFATATAAVARGRRTGLYLPTAVTWHILNACACCLDLPSPGPTPA